MRAYEYFEKYYHCVYAVSDIYEYTTNFINLNPYTDEDLREAQALVWFSMIHILDIKLKWVVKWSGLSYTRLQNYMEFIESVNCKRLKQKISLMHKELKNDA
jgi:hypothetical protein